MSADALRVVWADDSDDELDRLRSAVARAGRDVRLERVEDPAALRDALARGPVDVVLSRWVASRISALDALGVAMAMATAERPVFVVVSASTDEASALEAIGAGADDFVPIDALERLAPVIDRARARRAREPNSAECAGLAERLRRSDARFRQLVATTTEGIWSLDAGFVTDFVNTRLAAMLGYAPAEMLGLPAIEFIDPGERAASEQQIEARREGVAGSRELRLRRKDGSWLWVRMESNAMFGPTGALEGALAVVADLSEQRRAERALLDTEAQLRQAQKMEAIGRLAGGIAHDFNNLLSAVLAYSEVAMDDLGPEHPVYDDVAQIRLAGERAAALTSQLLMFSRRQVLEPRSLDPSEVLEGIDKMLRRVLGDDIELVTVPGQTIGCVRADRSSLEQVIMNLAVNARDAMAGGGRLTIATAPVFLDEAFARTHVGVVPGPHVSLTVTDNGTGMDADTMAHVFEPFFTTKPTGRGTGLGLSTVFGIVQQSRGTIWVESALGVGTTFTIYLPLVDRVDAPPFVARVVEKTDGTETILLVEDNDQVRSVAHDILRRHGYGVLEARSAGEALLICEGHPQPIHLLLTDVVMPQLSGPALARRLVAIRPSMKVLCMSGYTDDDAIRRGVLGTDVAYLPKPFTRESLTSKVREVLDGRAALAPS